MRIPLTPYGRAEIWKGATATAVGLGVAAWIGTVAGWAVGGALVVCWLLLLGYVLVFFRDFERDVPGAPGLLVAPADGTVTDVGTVTEPEFVGGPALRIGIFMSLVSCHVNRAPCDGTVAWLDHRPGRHGSATRPESAVQNESQWIGLDTEHGRVLVRQITGRIARHIVCPLAVGARVARGERFGMIKFGSRTEVYVPLDAGVQPAVAPGDRVAGGASVLARVGVAAPSQATPAPQVA